MATGPDKIKINNTNNKFPDKGNFSASQNNNGKNAFEKGIAKSALKGASQQGSLSERLDNAATNAKKFAIKKGAEYAAGALLTPAAGTAVKGLMNTKVGDKIAEAAAKNSDPISRYKNKKRKKKEKEQKKLAEQAAAEGMIPEEINDAVVPGSLIFGVGCFGIIILITVIAGVVLSPILYVDKFIDSAKDKIGGFWDNIIYFFKGCDNEYDCLQKQKDSFYEKILEVHEDYLEKYEVTLNTELITATLTYTDPMATMKDLGEIDDLSASSMTNFKKSKRKVEVLAENMISEGVKCVDSKGNVLAEYKEDEDVECPEPESSTYIDEDGVTRENKVSEKTSYYVDEDKYKKYLQEEFIRKFYFNNLTGEDIDKQIEIVIRNIYSRVEMVKYLNSPSNSSTNFAANNIQVRLMNCAGTMELETISLYEYLQGILYQEGYATARSEEFLKVQAVISKTYLFSINGAKPDSIPTVLSVKNCQMNQVYCNIEKGCHNFNDGNDASKYDSEDTLVSGDNNGSYLNPPITSVETLEKIKRAIDATLNEFIVKDGNFVRTEYRASCTETCDSSNNRLDQTVANQKVNSGSTYKEVLAHFYDGEITTITLGSGFPLDIVYNRVTSPFGWRIHPTLGYCKFHDGIDFGRSASGLSIDGANIYSIADGVVTLNTYSSTAGYYTIIGHGANINGNYEYYSVYMHQKVLSTLISVGSEVKAGQLIGYVGNTGRSTGSHLHFGIYTIQNGKRVYTDPVPYFQGVQLVGDLSSSSSCGN